MSTIRACQCRVYIRPGLYTLCRNTKLPENSSEVRIPLRKTSLRNFGNSVYPALLVSFGGDTKSRRSLLSGVYARGSKISHQSALECVTVVDSTSPNPSPVRPLWHWRNALYRALPIIRQDKSGQKALDT